MVKLNFFQKEAAKNTNITLLMRGYDAEGRQVYVYLLLPLLRFEEMQREVQESGYDFDATKYGTILADGYGDPPLEVMREMEEKYGVLHKNYIDVPVERLPDADIEPDSDDSDEN